MTGEIVRNCTGLKLFSAPAVHIAGQEERKQERGIFPDLFQVAKCLFNPGRDLQFIVSYI